MKKTTSIHKIYISIRIIFFILLIISLFAFTAIIKQVNSFRKSKDKILNLLEFVPSKSPHLLSNDLNHIKSHLLNINKKIIFIPDFGHDYYIMGYYLSPIEVFPYIEGMDLKNSIIILFKNSTEINKISHLSTVIKNQTKYFEFRELNE